MRLARNCLTEGSIQPREQTGLHQKRLPLRWLVRQDLFKEVAVDKAMLSGKGLEDLSHACVFLEQQGRQLHPRDPSFGTLFQQLHLLVKQGPLHQFAEIAGDFLRVESEIALINFKEL